jgi:hypothetical protein
MRINYLLILISVIIVVPELCAQDYRSKTADVLREQILSEAEWALKQQPVTVTASSSPRSAGTKNDFFSEADYFWPDTLNPEGPYVNRDGMTNPGIFTDHRFAMIRFSRIIGSLASAYVLTGKDKYVKHAMVHLKAWFVNADTRMNPSMTFAQAIKGRNTGRGIGIIDTIHLMEVAQGVKRMTNAKNADASVIEGTKKWFADYLTWLTSHQYGKDEMNTKNNHSTCWVMQVASYANLTDNQELLDFCRDRYKTVLLPNQMGEDGSFPLETKRTKPYGYSIFNLDAMVMVCHILSDSKNDLWNFQTTDGRSIRKGLDFLYPYILDKSSWPFQKDVMYWENWPVAQPFLIFGAQAFGKEEWFSTWKNLDHKPEVVEVVRNLPIRNPVIWFN